MDGSESGASILHDHQRTLLLDWPQTDGGVEEVSQQNLQGMEDPSEAKSSLPTDVTLFLETEDSVPEVGAEDPSTFPVRTSSQST